MHEPNDFPSDMRFQSYITFQANPEIASFPGLGSHPVKQAIGKPKPISFHQVEDQRSACAFAVFIAMQYTYRVYPVPSRLRRVRIGGQNRVAVIQARVDWVGTR